MAVCWTQFCPETPGSLEAPWLLFISKHDSPAFLLILWAVNSLPTRLLLFKVARIACCNQKTLVDILQDKAYSPITYSNDVLPTKSPMPTASWDHPFNSLDSSIYLFFRNSSLTSPHGINRIKISSWIYSLPPKRALRLHLPEVLSIVDCNAVFCIILVLC